jgi:hypothetical protein
VGRLVKEKRLLPPIEVNLTSGTDELLVCYRLDADPKNLLKPHRLYGDKSKWHTDSTFPVTAVVTDQTGMGSRLRFPQVKARKLIRQR